MSCFLLKKSDQKTFFFLRVMCCRLLVCFWKNNLFEALSKTKNKKRKFLKGWNLWGNLLLCIPLILLMQFSQGYPQSLKCKTCSFYQSIPYRKFPLVLGSSFIDVVFFLRVFMGTRKTRCLLSNNFSLVTWTVVHA